MSFQDNGEAFAPFPVGIEPPDPEAELAAQEELEATTASARAPVTTLAPIGRTYAMDLQAGRFTPDGLQPLTLRGADALRLNVEKILRTERGAAAVHTDEYGTEGVEDLIEGQAFESSEFAEYETRATEALLARPYILSVDNFDVAYAPGDDAVFVTMRVVGTGAGGNTIAIDLDQVPIPIS